MINDLILKNRSYRRFYQDVSITMETLKGLINLARLSPAAANVQPLKYILSNESKMNESIFKYLSWAGYLTDWDGPKDGEKPSAYIIILGDKEIKDSFGVDPGIVAQSMLLGAVEKGYGGCMFASISRKPLRSELNISDRYEILLIVALGKPKETVVIDDVGSDNDIKYWRDDKGIHHVPKRKLDSLILSV